MTLTEAGLNAGPGLGLAPVGLLFQYLSLLRAAGPQEWVWREIKAISDMKFRWGPGPPWGGGGVGVGPVCGEVHAQR
jgi:secreted Zn-dependent insulinase-like peptidase